MAETLEKGVGDSGSEVPIINSKPQRFKVYFLGGTGKLHGVYRKDLMSNGLSSCTLLLP